MRLVKVTCSLVDSTNVMSNVANTTVYCEQSEHGNMMYHVLRTCVTVHLHSQLDRLIYVM